MKLEVRNLNTFFEDTQILKNVNMDVPENSVTALIGPSGCGKSTFIRTINRMNDLIPTFSHNGNIYLDGVDVYDDSVDVVDLRKKVGMVFQKPNPFPKSIFDNVAYGLRIHGEEDEVIPLADVLAWARPQQLPVVVFPGAGHFFHGKLIPLGQLLNRLLTPMI